ncbi:MAG TPA: hypothetical protein VG253_17610 [Streptosporangiaceae bacterium]|nr:hypothetical protein [Streptosporangiaceae bacterium]
MIKHPQPVRMQQCILDEQSVMPMMDPITTLAEISNAARAQLPGSSVRRRLFFRYTLRWDEPR